MVTHDDTCVSTQEVRETRGDLYILFDVVFPKRLPGPDKRRELIAALTPAADE